MASQNEIATDIQKGIEKANTRTDDKPKAQPAEQDKATQFDGNPNPGADKPGGVLKPKDDTPAVIPKRESHS